MLSRVDPQDDFERRAMQWFEAMTKFRHAKTLDDYRKRKP